MTQAMQHDRPNGDLDLLTEVDQLLAGFADADNTTRAASIETLYHHYKPVATRYARRENATDLEGIVDLALFDTFRALTDMRNVNDQTFRRYMFRAIQSQSINESRKPVPTPTEVDDRNVEPTGGFESDLIGSLHLGDLIDELPEDQRAVMTHRIIHGRTADETGIILGKKTNAVYQLQHRATKRLQRILLTAAVLLMLIGAAIVITRQADSQTIDSSPARQTTIEQTQPTTTPNNNQATTELTISDQNQPNTDQQIQAGTIEQQPATSTTVATTDAAPSDTADSDTADSNTPNPDPETTTPDANTPATTTPATTTPTTPEAPAATTPTTTSTQIETSTSVDELGPGFRAVNAVDDVLHVSVGEAVDFNVMTNDGPDIALGTVSRISGRVEGLTLGPDGRITGIPTQAVTSTIVYRLEGNNETSDTAMVRIVVE